jgi:hypothetical protein
VSKPEAIVEAALASVRASQPESLDAAFAVTAEQFPDSRPEQVLQALAARGFFAKEGAPALLKDAAREANACLCSKCFGHVASPIPLLPKPANLSHGRLNADGAIVEVVEGWWGRRVVMDVVGPVEIESMQLQPRVKATFTASVVFALLCVGLLVWPGRWLSPLVLAFLLAWAGWGFYFLLRWFRPRWPRADRVAINAAWGELVPRIASASSLIRVCRASIGVGSISERAKPLRQLIEKIAEESNPNARTLQLLAVLRVLQVFDGSELGKDKACGLVAVFEPFFEGELPVAYAEAAAQTVLESGEIIPGDLLRLRILLFAAAFDARYSSADIQRLLHPLRFMPELMKPPELDVLNELYAVWRGLTPNAAEQAGTAATIFDLARTSPTLSRKLLSRWHDTLLRILLPESLQKGLGEVILTPRGLFLDDLLIEESDATIEIERSPTGSGWYLAVGPHKISADRKPPLKIAEALASWLDFRRTKLLAALQKEVRSNAGKVRRIELQSLAECSWCGAVNVVRVGEVGETFASES